MKRIIPNKSAFLYVPIISGIWGVTNFFWGLSWRSFLAGFISGIIFGLILVMLLFIFNINSNKKMHIVISLSGFVGGIVWGLVYSTSLSLILIGLFGAVITPLLYLFENFYFKKNAV